jgi:hypothetical protein
MNGAYVIGTGMIRFNKYPDKSVRNMAEEAIALALEDAGLGKEAMQAAFFSNTFWGMFAGQHSIRGQVVLRGMGRCSKGPAAISGRSARRRRSYAALFCADALMRVIRSRAVVKRLSIV